MPRSNHPTAYQWYVVGRCCNRCGDLEMINPDDGPANGPFTDGFCTNCQTCAFCDATTDEVMLVSSPVGDGVFYCDPSGCEKGRNRK